MIYVLVYKEWDRAKTCLEFYVWDIMKINHYGIIVSDLHKTILDYLKLGYSFNNQIFIDVIQNNKVAFLSLRDHVVELIEPLNELSSVRNFKEGYHHICYEGELGEDVIQRFKEMKIGKIFTKPIVAPALENRKVVFACLTNGTFIELII